MHSSILFAAAVLLTPTLSFAKHLIGLACEHHNLQIKCMPGEKIFIIHGDYGRQNRRTCINTNMHNLACTSPGALNIIRKRCQNKQTCDIPSSNGEFGDPCLGTYKYTEVHYNCVKDPECHNKQDCRFLNAHACEGQTLQLKCNPQEKISIIDGNYGRFNTHTCSHSLMGNLACTSPDAVNVIQNRCENKVSCEIPSNNGMFGDPCVGTYKYTEVNYKCVKDSSLVHGCNNNEFMCDDGMCIQHHKRCDAHVDCSNGEDELKCDYATAYACEHHSPVVIQCHSDEVILVLSANYGRNLKHICTYQENRNCNSAGATKIIQNRCNNQNQCTVSAENSIFGDPCPGIYKYLAVNYICLCSNCFDFNIITEAT